MSTNQRIRGRRLQRRRQLYRDRQPWCVVCASRGVHRPWTELDHTVAMENGGTDTDDNIQGLCDDCHAAKTAQDMGYKRRFGCDVDGNPIDPDHHWASHGA